MAETNITTVMDGDELACRIAECVMGAKRPNGFSPSQALAQMDDESRNSLRLAAKVACEFVLAAMTQAITDQMPGTTATHSTEQIFLSQKGHG